MQIEPSGDFVQRNGSRRFPCEADVVVGIQQVRVVYWRLATQSLDATSLLLKMLQLLYERSPVKGPS